MLKKILSTVISAGIICAGLTMPVTAASLTVELTGWEQSWIGNTNYDASKTGIEIIPDEGADGYACLHMFTGERGMNVRARQTITGLEQNKTYRLTGKLKTNGSGYRCTMRFGDEGASRMDLNNMGGYVSGQWFEFSKDFTYTYSSKLFTIYLESDGNDKYIYADNLSLREVEEGGTLGEELLVNGDFEMDYAVPDEADFIQAAPANGFNYLNVKSDLPVNIYLVTNNGEQKLDLGDPVYNNATYNLKVYKHNALQNEQNYRYIVKTVNSKNVESAGVEVNATPSEDYSDFITLDGWQYKNYNQNYGKVTIENGKGIGGSAALQASNMTDSNANSTYLQIKNQNGFTLESGKTYQLSYWEKDGVHNSLENSLVVKVNNSKVSVDGGVTYNDKDKNVSPAVFPADGEWHKQTLYLQAEAENNTLQIQINRHYEWVLFDNFELYEVDNELNVVSGAKNLMADSNGNFENETVPADVYVSFNYYPAYADEEHYGEIMDPAGISALTDLSAYDTDVIYAQATIDNQLEAEGKDFALIFALYNENVLQEAKMIKSKAAFGKSENYGFSYKVPDLSTGEYSIKLFVWDSFEDMIPIVPSSEITEISKN